MLVLYLSGINRKRLEAICLKAMAPRREDRYQTALALAEALAPQVLVADGSGLLVPLSELEGFDGE